jgi:Domain of unknown function (DUF4329)
MIRSRVLYWGIVMLVALYALSPRSVSGAELPLQRAAIHVLQGIADVDGCVERAGIIIEEPDGSYRATAPQPGAESSFSIDVWLKRGERIAAIYHTHPLCGEARTDVFFSPGDVETADKLKVPSFIYVAYDHSIREFVPGKSPTRYFAKLHSYIAPGLVLATFRCWMQGVRLNMSGRVDYVHVCAYDPRSAS